jgi:IclR family pca regulon transcriptional regulator
VLGHRISELGLLAGKSNPILAIVQPVLDRLSLDLGESVSAARLLRAGITCIATAVSVQDISIHTRVGRIYEAAGTAHGQIWLAHMTDDERRAYLADLSPAGSQAKGRPNPLPDSQEFERIRNDGFCVNSGGQQEEIGGVAVPVIDAQGKIVLTLAAYCFVSRLTDEMIDRSVEKLSQAAQTISLAVSTGATGAK